MTTSVENGDTAIRSPYKGPNPYELSDSDLFFGRDGSAHSITSTVLAKPVTLLYAPSGAGKTSILNTRILPGLEANGLTCVVVRLGTEPARAIRDAILAQVFPDPVIEAERMSAAVGALELDSGACLADALRKFDQCRRSGLACPSLLKPEGTTLPFTARIFNGSISVSRFLELLNFATAGSLWSPEELVGGQVELPLVEIATLLREKRARSAHTQLIQSLRRDTATTADLVRSVFMLCTGALESFEIVLCFDQFEEIFSRFGSTSRTPDSGWRQREALFADLATIAGSSYWGSSNTGHHLPPVGVRFFFSFRDEFVAAMDRVYEFIPRDCVGTCRLGFMRVAEAREAIAKPAAAIGVKFQKQCIRQIVKGLLIEGQWVEPGHVSIVCDRLWRHTQGVGVGSPATRVVTLKALKDAGDVSGLLDGFVNEVADRLTVPERFEAVQLLTALQVSEGFRQIVERRVLIERPLRSATRERVLVYLQKMHFVRVHEYRGVHLVDVTHEAILRAIVTYRRRQQLLQPALDAPRQILSRIQDRLATVAKLGRWECLGPDDLGDLDAWKTAIDWEMYPSACELILRSLLARNARPENGPLIEDWSRLYRNSVLGKSHAGDPAAGSWESYLESPSLWRFRSAARDHSLPKSESVRLRVLRSLIEMDRSLDGALVMDCVTRMVRS